MFIPDFVRSALSSNNQFASGGMLLMLIGGVLAFLKGIPAKLLRWFLDQTTMSMTIIDEVEAFTWVKWWFQSQSYGKRTRRVDVYCPWFNNRNIALFTPAPGFHWFLYKKRPIWINLTRTEDKKNSGYHTTRAESMVIGTFGRNQK